MADPTYPPTVEGELEPPGTGPTKLPGWALALFGLLLAAILAVGGATLYLVSQLEDQATQSEEALQTSKATQALVRLVAVRQLKSKDIPAQLQAANEELLAALTQTQAQMAEMQSEMTAMQSQMTEMQTQVAETQVLLVETEDTMNELLAEVEAASAKAKDTTAALQAKIDTVRQNLQELRATLDAELGKIRARLASIERKLS